MLGWFYLFDWFVCLFYVVCFEFVLIVCLLFWIGFLWLVSVLLTMVCLQFAYLCLGLMILFACFCFGLFGCLMMFDCHFVVCLLYSLRVWVGCFDWLYFWFTVFGFWIWLRYFGVVCIGFWVLLVLVLFDLCLAFSFVWVA